MSEAIDRVATAIGNAPYPPQLHVMGEAHKRDMARAAIAAVFDWMAEAAQAGTDEAFKAAASEVTTGAEITRISHAHRSVIEAWSGMIHAMHKEALPPA